MPGNWTESGMGGIGASTSGPRRTRPRWWRAQRGSAPRHFCDRWQAKGYALGWVPGATVHHLHELNLWSFVRQHYNYGRGILSFRLNVEIDPKLFDPDSLATPLELIPAAAD